MRTYIISLVFFFHFYYTKNDIILVWIQFNIVGTMCWSIAVLRLLIISVCPLALVAEG